MIHIIQEEAYK